MSERNIYLLLTDIADAIDTILTYTDNYTFDDYENDQKTRHAVERNFGIIGEAAAKLPENYKSEKSEIEWRVLKDFRNFIIHDYIGIDNRIVWDTIQKNLPGLRSEIKRLIAR